MKHLKDGVFLALVIALGLYAHHLSKRINDLEGAAVLSYAFDVHVDKVDDRLRELERKVDFDHETRLDHLESELEDALSFR